MAECVDFVISEVPVDVGHLRELCQEVLPGEQYAMPGNYVFVMPKPVRNPFACTVFDWLV